MPEVDILTHTIDVLKISFDTEQYFQIMISNKYEPIYLTASADILSHRKYVSNKV